MTFYFDSETYSDVDLKVVGLYRYADHPSTSVILATYAFDGGPVRTWSPAEGQPIPADLLEALRSAPEITAHNSQFDRNVVARALYRMKILTSDEMLALLNPMRWRCTMVKALAHALPGDLDTLGKVLGLGADQTKIKEGKTLIRRFCMPTPANYKLRRNTHETHPEQWARFIQYAQMDIVAMRACDKRIPDWNLGPREVALWHLDQKINDRGFYCDVELVDAAVRSTAEEKALLAQRFVELTGGEVLRPTMRDQFRQFLAGRHCLALENTQAETLRGVRARYPDDSEVAELLDIALASNKTSTSKYARIQPAIGPDRRFRGGLQFAGAGRTRRWSGRNFQPHNLPSRGLPKSAMVDAYISAVKADTHTAIFDKLMWYGSAALRGVVTAPPGRHIVAADLSNIEGRMLAWVAREDWKLDAFRAYDAGTGPDLYKVTAGVITGVDPWKVEKKIRNSLGKVSDLACFAADTLVLTDNGLKPIVNVRPEDRVWDGVEWVKHSGVVDQGIRAVINLAGVEVTPDHLIRTGRTWKQAEQLASSEQYLYRALETGSANLPFSGSDLAQLEAFARSRFDAPAGQPHTRRCSTTSSKVDQPAATGAPRKQQEPTQSGTTSMRTSWMTRAIAGACSIELRHALPVVEIQRTQPIRTTVVEAYASCSKTVNRFLRTLSRYLDGINQSSNSIELMSIVDTKKAIFGSSLKRRTAETSDPCKTSRGGSLNLKRVYDVAHAGPRTRFTIWTERGWMLVHNSGYQGGASGYQQFARAYGVKLADYWDVLKETAPDAVAKALKNLNKVWARKQIADLEIDELEWLASETCKIAWRSRHPATVTFWYALQDAAISAVEFPGSVHEVTYLKVSCREHCGHKWLQILLPSGNRLCYFHPEVVRTVEREEETERETVRKSLAYWSLASEEGGPRLWQRTFTHGGKLTGNVCQTLARDILAHNMPPIEEAGYQVVLTVHDEVVAEAPVSLNEEEMVRILATNPPWSAGLPLAAAGFHHERYMKED